MGLNESTGRPPGTGPAEVAPQSASRFRIDIGELVLDGFDARVDPGRVTAAFQAELARLVRERGVPLAEDGTGAALDGLTGLRLPPLPAATSPARLGEALARAVHAGLAGRSGRTELTELTGRAGHTGRTGRGNTR
ncbi:hypothetical protein ACFY12_04690 [Streptomyces sp. NPDC001339]|uniref:hypothetical protein n=1 Tax=Streptomyces sp. NPDC001339 TaxID=3364563 RepID=UPI0036A17C51